MKSKKVSRRSFLTTISTGTAALATAKVIKPMNSFPESYVTGNPKLAALGGEKLVKNKG